MTAILELRRRVAESIRPPADLLPSEWAEDTIRLTDGDKPGPITFGSGYEFQREILDSFFKPFARGERRRVGVCFKGAQSGVTTISQIGLLYRSTHLRRSVFHLLPREFDAQDKAKKIGEMVGASPELERHFIKSPERVRKTAHGQSLRVSYSNSQSELKNWQAGDGVFDEVDELESRDFDSVAMAKQRMGSYRKTLELYIGTPTLPEYGIHKIWQESDQRHYFVPCPLCDHDQRLTWEGNIDWSNDHDTLEAKAATARFKCSACDGTWDQRMRERANGAGQWVASRPTSPVIGFGISRLYVPTASPSKMVSDYLAGVQSEQAMREHVNQNLGDVYLPSTGKLDEHTVEQVITEEIEWERVPKGTVLVTAGVDVQGESEPFEYVWEVRAYNADGFASVIGYGFAKGDRALQDILGSHSQRGRFVVGRAIIDITDGHHKEAVLRLCDKIPCLQPGRFDWHRKASLERGKVIKSKSGKGYSVNRDDALQDNLGRFFDAGERGVRIAVARCPRRALEREWTEQYTKIARVKDSKGDAQGVVYSYRKLREKSVDFPFAGALAEYARRATGSALPAKGGYGATADIKKNSGAKNSQASTGGARSAIRVIGKRRR